MAHSCPDCGQCCYCNGDIDDLLLDCDAAVMNCTHCNCPACGATLPFCDCEPVYCEEDPTVEARP